MKGYYLTCCYQNQDNRESYRDHIEHGVFLNKADAKAEADKLNEPARKEWQQRCSKVKAETLKRQERWDKLNAAGLSACPRPKMNTNYLAEWKPGIGGGDYYLVEECDVFPAQTHEFVQMTTAGTEREAFLNKLHSLGKTGITLPIREADAKKAIQFFIKLRKMKQLPDDVCDAKIQEIQSKSLDEEMYKKFCEIILSRNPPN